MPTATNAKFSVFGFPVLYMPWGIFPVKSERQSGFLLPDFTSSSRDGEIIRNAYFWAIAKDKDATFFFDWIENRGVKPGVEYRYALSDTTKGQWYGTIIDDKKYDHTRYQIKGEHEELFGDDLKFKADINRVSDFDYLEDLGLTTLERSENSLRSVAFAEGAPQVLASDSRRRLFSGPHPEEQQRHPAIPARSLLLYRVCAHIKAEGVRRPLQRLDQFHGRNGDRFTRFVAAPRSGCPTR